MRVVEKRLCLQEQRAQWKGLQVAFVPTMGALHEGHLSLVRRAREVVGEKGKVVVSIFLNPTQFDRKEDLEHYPHSLEEDLCLCEAEGVDLVFCPTAEEMYAADASIMVVEQVLSGGLCGARRPGHFNGVCTVVLKLYHLVRPSLMVFGEKDFQQLAVIRRLVRDLYIDVEVLGVETAREDSGLARSSRNRRLSDEEREEAAEIYATLQRMRTLLGDGSLPVQEVEEFFTRAMDGLRAETRVDYVELVEAETLQPLRELRGRQGVLAVAVYFGQVRLIDHISIKTS